MKSLLMVLGLMVSTASYAEVAANGLIGSVWTANGQSGDLLITYVLRFNQDNLVIESTCRADEVASTLKSQLAASYSDNGAVAKLNAGLLATIPTGRGSCSVAFPAGLQFQRDQDRIFIEYDGTRRLTGLKRQN